MGFKTTLSVLRFEFHALGAGLLVGLLMLTMFHLFGTWEQDYALLISFAVFVFLISLVRIDLGLTILLIGMLFSPETEIGEARTRSITIRAEDLLVVSLMMAWVVRSVLMGAKLKSTPINVPIVMFLTALLVSTTGGIARGWIEPKLAVFYVGKLVEFFAIFFFAVNFIEDKKQIHLLLAIFLAIGGFVSLYGLSQVGEVARLTAPFEGGTPEPNTFGGYLMTIIAVAIPFAVHAPSLRLRLTLVAISGVAFAALLFTLSRASFLALLGTFVVLGVLCRNRMIWAGLFLFIVLHQMLLPEEVFDRVNYTFQSTSGVLVQLPFEIPFVGDSFRVDKSTYERIDVWNKVFYTWTFNVYYFFFGWGVTRLHILDSQFARFLVEIGAVGCTFFIWILWKIFRSAWWLKDNTEDWVVRSFAIGYLACFFGVLIHSLGTITFYIVRIMEPFWFLTGILMWWYAHEREKREPETSSGKIWQPDLPWRQVDA